MLEAQVWPIDQQLYVMELEAMNEKSYDNPVRVIYTLRCRTISSLKQRFS